MTRSLRVTPLITALLVALVLSACGGSDNGSADSATASEPSSSASASDAASDSATTQTDETTDESETASMSATDSDESMATDSASEGSADGTTSEASASASGGDMSGSDNPVTVTSEGVAQVTIGGTDQMQYTVKEFTVEAGQEVELTLIHEGSLPINQMGHNVVILQAGEDYMTFGRQLTSGGNASLENDYLPEGMRDGLVAYTDMIGGGESTTIRFTAPDTPGDYPYLCSFPGHYPMMNGVMVVR